MSDDGVGSSIVISATEPPNETYTLDQIYIVRGR